MKSQLPVFDSEPGWDLSLRDLLATESRYRCHLYAWTSTDLSCDFVWEQILRTENYSKWLGLQLPALPKRFSRGTRLDGRIVSAIVIDAVEDFTLQICWSNQVLVLEVGQHVGGRYLVGPGHQQTHIRMCLDIFYPSWLSRLLASKKRHQLRIDEMLDSFVSHCESEWSRPR